MNCTVTDASGNSTTTLVAMTIKQVESGLRLTPHAATLKSGSTTPFAGTALDQFKHVMRTVSTVAYKMQNGSGSISSDGLFTAGNQKGHIMVQVTVDDLTGTVGATIV